MTNSVTGQDTNRTETERAAKTLTSAMRDQITAYDKPVTGPTHTWRALVRRGLATERRPAWVTFHKFELTDLGRSVQTLLVGGADAVPAQPVEEPTATSQPASGTDQSRFIPVVGAQPAGPADTITDRVTHLERATMADIKVGDVVIWPGGPDYRHVADVTRETVPVGVLIRGIKSNRRRPMIVVTFVDGGSTDLRDTDHWITRVVLRPDTPTTTTEITPRSLALFLDYARDAGNWGGNPLVGGNVGGSREDRGNLTQLKQAGLIQTFTDGRHTHIEFTPAGDALAHKHGVCVGECPGECPHVAKPASDTAAPAGDPNPSAEIERGRRAAAELIATGLDDRTLGGALDLIRPEEPVPASVRAYRAAVMDELHERAHQQRCLALTDAAPARNTKTRQGVSLSELRAGMDVQAPEGRRRWYRVLTIDIGDHHQRSATVEVLGGKDAGRVTQINFFDYPAYRVRVPATQEPAAVIAAAPAVEATDQRTAHISDGRQVDAVHADSVRVIEQPADEPTPIALADAIDRYVHVTGSDADYHGDIVEVTDTTVTLVDWTRWVMGSGKPDATGRAGQPLVLDLSDITAIRIEMGDYDIPVTLPDTDEPDDEQVECTPCKGTGFIADQRATGNDRLTTTVQRKHRACKGTGRITLVDPAAELREQNRDQEIGDIPDWMLDSPLAPKATSPLAVPCDSTPTGDVVPTLATTKHHVGYMPHYLPLRARIRRALIQLSGLATQTRVDVSVTDFVDWAAVVGAPDFAVCRNSQGRIHAWVTTPKVAVHTVADTLAGHEVPQRDAEVWSMRLPTADAAKLGVADTPAAECDDQECVSSGRAALCDTHGGEFFAQT